MSTQSGRAEATTAAPRRHLTMGASAIAGAHAAAGASESFASSKVAILDHAASLVGPLTSPVTPLRVARADAPPRFRYANFSAARTSPWHVLDNTSGSTLCGMRLGVPDWAQEHRPRDRGARVCGACGHEHDRRNGGGSAA